MSYDENLADRIRKAIGPRPDVTEKKMFGGLAFLLDGKMFCGVVEGDFMVRVGPEAYERALAITHVRHMDFTGRPMKGYVFVEPGGTKTAAAVRTWVERATQFVATIERGPTKKRKKPRLRAR